MPGPSEPDLKPESANPNRNPKRPNGSPEGERLRAPKPVGFLGPIKETYGGTPTKMVRAIALLRSGPVKRSELIAKLKIHPVEATRVLRELCHRGYAEKIRHGVYQLTTAGANGA